MAAPTIRGQTAPVAGLTTTSPAGTQVGDLVIVITAERLAGGSGSTLTKHSSMTAEIRNHFHNDGSTDGALAAAWQIATVAGAQSYQGFTSSTGSPVAQTGCIVLSTTTYGTDIITATSATQTTNAVPDPASIGSLNAARDYLVIAVAFWHLGSSLDNAATAPTNYTNLVQFSGAATLDLAWASRARTAVTSEDPGAFGDSQAPNGTATLTIAVPNAPAAATGTGALVAQNTAAVGAGTSSSTGTGATTAQAAAADGEGTVADSGSSGSGALSAQAATASGAGTSSSTGTGAPAAQAASAAGSGTSQSTGTGTPAAQAATVAGVGASRSTGSGALSAQAATVDGLGGDVGVTGSGDLVAGVSDVTASGVSASNGTGVLTAASATAGGTGTSRSTGSGAPAAGSSQALGAGTSASSGAGVIAASNAQVIGSTEQQGPRWASFDGRPGSESGLAARQAVPR